VGEGNKSKEKKRQKRKKKNLRSSSNHPHPPHAQTDKAGRLRQGGLSPRSPRARASRCLTPALCVPSGFPQTQHTLAVSVTTWIAQTAAVGQTSGAERPAVPLVLPSPGGARGQCAGRGAVSSAVHHAVDLACARLTGCTCRHTANFSPHLSEQSASLPPQASPHTHTLP
jgi:hypothetical protein